MLHGFAEVSKMELLLSLVSVGLLGVALGIGLALIIRWIKAPAYAAKLLKGHKPEPCTKAHCDDFEQLGQWLGARDFSIITNEQLHELRQKAKTYEAKPQPLRTPMVLTPEQEEKVRRIFERDSRPTWPGGEPVDI